MKTVLLAGLAVVQSAAFFAPPAGMHTSRAAPVVMKGKGTRGMPGKAVRPPPGSGFNKASKKRMQKRELDRDEWTLVGAHFSVNRPRFELLPRLCAS